MAGSFKPKTRGGGKQVRSRVGRTVPGRTFRGRGVTLPGRMKGRAQSARVPRR